MREREREREGGGGGGRSFKEIVLLVYIVKNAKFKEKEIFMANSFQIFMTLALGIS